ncbi:MAG: phosphoglycerate kinase [Chloroflexota bacterium]|nr:MAG: phosphoglycerate kinase [Chloroflexota bacterium]
MFTKMTLRDIEVKGKKVLVREDLNVPLTQGKITDDTRVIAALPTINYLVSQGAAVIIMSHLGRPGGERKDEFSLRPVAKLLDTMLITKVKFVSDCIGQEVKKIASELGSGEVLVLENTRFYPGEESNDPEFAGELASLAEIFVNDAFGTSHRAHASNVGVARHLPTVAGFLLEKEIQYLGNAIEAPDRPFTAILGGAKVSGKIGVINNLLSKVDTILIGGGMANTFFASQGIAMGNSLVESDALDVARELLERAGDKLVLPVDFVIGDKFAKEANREIQEVGDVPDDWMIMDIGPETLLLFSQKIAKSKTIIWNGPMGVFEFPPFSAGTFGLAKLISESKALSIIGGGDSAAAVKQAGLEGKITHISTGGGASLKMLEGASLPGLEAVLDK